jgi:hypothetical protein
MNLPIIFFHRGKSDYLKYSLNQARFYNPDSDIYLLGDQANNKYPFIKHHLISDYDAEAKQFEKIYKHFSTNSYQIELFCFQRWFVIREFIRTKHLEKFLYLDSDILLYCNAAEVFRHYDQYKFTICSERSPHCSYFSSLKTLDEFCNFITSLYTDENNLKRFELEFKERLAKGLHGGMCDMSAFYEFSKLNPGKVADLTSIHENSVFDDNFSFSQGYETEHGRKKMYWKDRLPYGKHLTDGKLIRFNALHFQGNAKSMMDKYYTGEGLTWDRLKKRFRRFRKGIK